VRKKSALRMSLMTFFLAIISYSCSVEWNNPLETDSELKETPVIKEIALTEENNILINLGRVYSDSVQILLERNEDGLYLPITPVRTNLFSLLDTSFDKETQHYFMYRYRVKKGEYVTEYCQPREFKYTGEFLYPPDNFRQQTIELKGIRFNWRDRSHAEEAYVVEKDEGSGYETIAQLPANSETYFDSMEGVFDPPLYLRYRIYAMREGMQSSALEFETEYSGLGSPTNLRITDSSSWHFTIEWQDNSNIEDGYVVERSKDGAGFQVIRKLTANSTEYTDILNELGTFTYRVRAYKGSYYSGYSNDVEINIINLIPTDGLLAYYPFNGNANDESGNGHNGEVIGSVLTTDRFGRSDMAYYFNGSNSYINSELDVSETDYTLSLWFKTNCNSCGIYSVVSGAGAHDRHVYLNSGNIYARIYSEETIHGANIYSDDQWHHVVHEYSSDIGGQRIYVDGKLEAKGTKSNSNFTWQTHIRIGYSVQAYYDYFNGSIDDVRIYNRALSEDEINTLFHEGGWKQQ